MRPRTTPSVARAVAQVRDASVLLDGEIVAIDERGPQGGIVDRSGGGRP